MTVTVKVRVRVRRVKKRRRSLRGREEVGVECLGSEREDGEREKLR
jgi:hypothetical protein